MAKFRILVFFVILLVGASACSASVVSTPAQPAELPPTPFPDTPAPAEIKAPLVESPALVTINFLNELDGWGVTETQIVRTNDGGMTWHNVSPPELTEAGYGVGLFILDNSHAWIQKADPENYPNSGFLYSTLDGGMTWVSVKVPFSSASLTFLDASNGWAFADLGAGAGSQGVAVYQTTDGGADWKQTYINDPNSPNTRDSLPLGGIKSGLTPLNMKTAWVSGVVYSDGTVYLYRTDDGGANWLQVTSLSLPPAALNAQVSFNPVQFVTPQDAFLTVRIPSDQSQLAVYISNDAGNTWSLTPTLIPKGDSTDFLSATEAVIYNGEQFYVTHDSAHTWSIVPPQIVFGDTFMMMDFVNTSTGWVVTLDSANHRALYRTSDGGATWSPIIP